MDGLLLSGLREDNGEKVREVFRPLPSSKAIVKAGEIVGETGRLHHQDVILNGIGGSQHTAYWQGYILGVVKSKIYDRLKLLPVKFQQTTIMTPGLRWLGEHSSVEELTLLIPTLNTLLSKFNQSCMGQILIGAAGKNNPVVAYLLANYTFDKVDLDNANKKDSGLLSKLEFDI